LIFSAKSLLNPISSFWDITYLTVVIVWPVDLDTLVEEVKQPSASVNPDNHALFKVNSCLSSIRQGRIFVLYTLLKASTHTLNWFNL